MPGLVEAGVVEADRECPQRVGHDVVQQRHQRRRVETARQVRAHGNVGAQSDAGGIGQDLAKLALELRLGRRAMRARLRELPAPVGSPLEPPSLQHDHLARADLGHALEHRPRRERRPEREGLVEPVRVERRAQLAACEQRLDLGGEENALARAGVVERQDASTIPHQQQAAPRPVPERECELPVQFLHEVVAEFLVQVDDDLGIGVRVETVPALLEHAAQLDVVEDLAVVGDPDGLVFVVDRLRAAREVDDAEARVAEAETGLEMEARAVRSTMPQRRHHALQQVAIRRRLRRVEVESRESAHAGQAP